MAAGSWSPERAVEFGSFAELELLPEEPPSLWAGLLPLGSIVVLSGDAFSGKSTLLAGVLGAIERGESFLGQRTTKASAVWVSEEPEQALRAKAEMFRLFDLASSVAASSRVAGVGWATLIDQAARHAVENDHRFLVVDTFTGLAGLGAEEENDAGAVSERFGPLRVAASQGLAVLLVHHTAKHGGRGPRGSGAFRGLADVSIGFQRQGGSNRFTLKTESRYTTIAELRGALEQTADGWTYRLISSRDDAAKGSALAAISADQLLWDSLPVGSEAGQTFQEVADRSGLSIDQVKRRLRSWCELPRRDRVGRGGAGTKGDPYRWYRESGD